MEELKIQKLHADFTKSVEIEVQQEFAEKEQYSSKMTEKIVNLENSSCMKNKNNVMSKKNENKTFGIFKTPRPRKTAKNEPKNQNLTMIRLHALVTPI
jgi:hypothetical protein